MKPSIEECMFAGMATVGVLAGIAASIFALVTHPIPILGIVGGILAVYGIGRLVLWLAHNSVEKLWDGLVDVFTRR